MKKNIYNIKYLVCFVFGLGMVNSFAQQAPQYTQYMYNTEVINSGYTGSAGKLAASLLYRSQWAGIEGAPETQSFAVHGLVKDRIGLGLTAINDNLGASNTIQINGNFAYHLPTGENTKLALGINAGLDILNIDWSKGNISNNLDPVFQQDLNEVRPIVGAGLYYYSDKWYLGVSSNNLLNSKLYNDDSATVVDRKSQYYFMGGYVFDLSSTVKFKPAVLTKHVSGSPLTVDVSGNFLLQEKVALGVAYRYDDAISGLAGIYLSDKFFLGYAYDYSVTGLQNYNDGSHEIILTYNLDGLKKRALSPRFF